MNFKEVCKKLNIEEYEDRIWNSNSHGELAHLWDYFGYASLDDVSWFREEFLAAVKMAEKNWNRPESVFQHIPKIFDEFGLYTKNA